MPGPNGDKRREFADKSREIGDKGKDLMGKAVSAWRKRRNQGTTEAAWAPRRPQAGRLQTRVEPPAAGKPTTKPFAATTAELPAQDPAGPPTDTTDSGTPNTGTTNTGSTDTESGTPAETGTGQAQASEAGSPVTDSLSARTEPEGPDTPADAPTEPVPAAPAAS